MLVRISNIIDNECYLTKQEPIVVGVSGGVDSITLLDILHRLGYSVMAAHFGHGIRPEAHHDAELVQNFAINRDIQFVFDKGSVPNFSEGKALSIEEGARILRYHFLFDVATEYHAQAVVVAHNANDQVETFIMHLLRGAGSEGLKGMPVFSLPNFWSTTIPLVRPLLNVWREEIETYQEECGINSILDSTNKDVKFFRNRIRHELIPELETYIPGVGKRIIQTAEIISVDNDFLKIETQKAWDSLPMTSGDGYVAFPRVSFNLQSLSIKRRLVRKSVSLLRPGARDIDFGLVNRVVDFVNTYSKTFQSDIGLGLRVTLESEFIYISHWDASLPASKYPSIDEEVIIDIPGHYQIPDGWTLTTEIVDNVNQALKKALESNDLFQAWVDLGTQKTQIMVRGRKTGDRIVPSGMGGKSMKLSDLMINLKIPRRVRDRWPLICVGDVIIWVPGYRLAENVKIGPQTSIVVHFQLHDMSTSKSDTD